MWEARLHGRAHTVRMLVKEALTFRPCQAGDLVFIARLSGEAFAEYTPKAVSHTLDVVARNETWVAVRGSARVGFVTVSKEGAELAVLHAIAVIRGESSW